MSSLVGVRDPDFEESGPHHSHLGGGRTRSVVERPLIADPSCPRAEAHDHQRHLGETLGTVHTVEAALQRTAED